MNKQDAPSKPDPSVLPWETLWEIIRVFEVGARKYSVHGWKTVPNAQAVYKRALYRHVIRYASGEKSDEEGLPHLACIAANAMILLAIGQHEPDNHRS